MAAKELYDYISTIASDVDQTLAIDAQGEITEEGSFKQVINMGDDGSEERITLATLPIFYVTFDWNLLTEANMGTIFDLYFDAAKANGCGNSFKWSKRGDSHIYVVRFDCKLSRSGNNQARMGAKGIRLRVLGRIVDA
jgi:hypothetical protein